jgi:hypothetical protein
VEGWIVKGILQKIDQQVRGKDHTKVKSYV